MDLLLIILFAALSVEARMFCEKTKGLLELGEWRYDLKHLDSAVVENPPVSISEGQVYVYENFFPNYTLKYIHVDNLAKKTCGASVAIKSGGIDTSSVLILLHAEINQEIRSVVDIWGEKKSAKVVTKPLINPEEMRNIKSLYLFKSMRAVNHNRPY